MKRSIMNPNRQLIFTLFTLLTALLGSACFHLKSGDPPQNKIHQVGVVWLKQEGDTDARQKVINAVHEFGRLIPEVESAFVGASDGPSNGYTDASYDVCFTLTFADEAARQRYNKHPVHLKAANEIFLPLSKKLVFYRFTSR